MWRWMGFYFDKVETRTVNGYAGEWCVGTVCSLFGVLIKLFECLSFFSGVTLVMGRYKIFLARGIRRIIIKGKIDHAGDANFCCSKFQEDCQIVRDRN